MRFFKQYYLDIIDALYNQVDIDSSCKNVKLLSFCNTHVDSINSDLEVKSVSNSNVIYSGENFGIEAKVSCSVVSTDIDLMSEKTSFGVIGCNQIDLSDRCFEFSKVCSDNNVEKDLQCQYRQIDLNSDENVRKNVCLHSNDLCEVVELCNNVTDLEGQLSTCGVNSAKDVEYVNLDVFKEKILIDNLFLSDEQCVPACTFQCDVSYYNYIPSPCMSDDIAVDVCVNKFKVLI
jgi:hypothetical protein